MRCSEKYLVVIIIHCTICHVVAETTKPTINTIIIKLVSDKYTSLYNNTNTIVCIVPESIVLLSLSQALYINIQIVAKIG